MTFKNFVVTSVVSIAILLSTVPVDAQDLQGGINWLPWQNNAGLPVVYQQMSVAPGNYILQPGIPGCSDHRDTRVGDTANAVSAMLLRGSGVGAALASAGGAFMGWFVTRFQEETAGTSGFLAQMASDLNASPRYATCGTIVLVAPAGWHFVEAYPAAWSFYANPFAPGANTACNVPSGQPPYVKCQIPDAVWIVVRYPNYIVATFINWAQETRIADLEAPIAPN